jgi:hypothetical protein
MTESAATWDGALEKHASPSPLLQTWGWGEVQCARADSGTSPADGALASVQPGAPDQPARRTCPRSGSATRHRSTPVEQARAAKIAKPA